MKAFLAPLSRKQMDIAQCGDPNCTHADHPVLFLEPRCHQGRGVIAAYDKRTGLLSINCRICRLPVANIAVAETMGSA